MKPSVDEDIAEGLFAKRQKIYPRQVHGLFAYLRIVAVVALLGLYYGLPWVPWGNHPAILFDLPARKFYVFGLTFWPQDFFYLAMLLMIAAYTLFFFTTLAGRVWCGYACPQTVWTEIFIWIEHAIEGDRMQQMKLDKGPWNSKKIGKKFAKHSAWIIFALWTGFTFVGYFTPIHELGANVLKADVGGWELFWLLFYSFATWGNAGFMREQVCIYMCPYARFQSAMFDKNTLVISYDTVRGEPRGARKRGVDFAAQNLGSCIDCTMCVQVCPTGIDIRDGLQYQCIGCAACIDACDDVMERMNYPKGLIRYTTENALNGKPTRLLRPRVFIYASLLFLLLSGAFYGILHRVPLTLDVARDRNNLYSETDEGLVENVYLVRLLNRSEQTQRFSLALQNAPEGMQVIGAPENFTVMSGEMKRLPLRLRIDPAQLPQPSLNVYFVAQSLDTPALTVIEKARFVSQPK